MCCAVNMPQDGTPPLPAAHNAFRCLPHQTPMSTRPQQTTQHALGALTASSVCVCASDRLARFLRAVSISDFPGGAPDSHQHTRRLCTRCLCPRHTYTAHRHCIGLRFLCSKGVVGWWQCAAEHPGTWHSWCPDDSKYKGPHHPCQQHIAPSAALSHQTRVSTDRTRRCSLPFAP